MKRARRAGTLAVAAALALACVSPTGDEPEQHWLDSLAWAYERGDCAGVRERAAEPPLRAGPWLKLAALLLAGGVKDGSQAMPGGVVSRSTVWVADRPALPSTSRARQRNT